FDPLLPFQHTGTYRKLWLGGISFFNLIQLHKGTRKYMFKKQFIVCIVHHTLLKRLATKRGRKVYLRIKHKSFMKCIYDINFMLRYLLVDNIEVFDQVNKVFKEIHDSKNTIILEQAAFIELVL